MSDDKSQEERLNALAQKARDTLARCGNCAQTSFSVLQDEFDLDGGQILKALTPFPGLALRGETCGAVAGCLMALGLVFGRDDLNDWSGYLASLPPARRFCRRFEKEHGSTLCASILEKKLGRSYNLADVSEASEYLSAGGQAACGEVIASAVRLTAEAIMSRR